MTDDQIERVARAMCVHLGINPDGLDTLHYGQYTPLEVKTRGGVTRDCLVHDLIWKNYRHDAAIAIAGILAVSECFGRNAKVEAE